jgi:pimeloyl-ACP methyl ester carboxylesterase
MTILELLDARVHLALHARKAGKATPLLFLHELGGTAADWPDDVFGWDGPAYALDLSGHGRSGRVRGGAYTAPLWAADADQVLAHLREEAVLVGAGVGAYVALLLAGARPDAVRGALLLPGAGLHGAGPEPDFAHLAAPLTASGESGALRDTPASDPAVHYSEEDVRPAWYARALAETASCVVLVDDTNARLPEWWRGLRGLPRVHALTGTNPAQALAHLAQSIGQPELMGDRRHASRS